MEQMHETRAMDVEDARQVDQLQRHLGFTAYRVMDGEDLAGRQIVKGVYTAADMSRSFVDEPMLPIEEFSK